MKESDISLVCGDSTPWLLQAEPESADLLFADPPFNIGYSYDQYKDRRKPKDYLAWCETWIAAGVRTLKPGAAFWLAIGDDYAAELAVACKAAGLTMRNWCIWEYNFGVHCQTKFGRNKTHLLYFIKGKKKTKPAYWNPPRIESERQRMGDKRADPLGRVPGDVWLFSRICGTFKERTGHPCQMNQLVIERIITSTCPPGGLILDPFPGSFVTGKVAAKTGRRCHGCELSQDYVNESLADLSVQSKQWESSKHKFATNCSAKGNSGRKFPVSSTGTDLPCD